jgi:hypothetical protein
MHRACSARHSAESFSKECWSIRPSSLSRPMARMRLWAGGRGLRDDEVLSHDGASMARFGTSVIDIFQLRGRFMKLIQPKRGTRSVEPSQH